MINRRLLLSEKEKEAAVLEVVERFRRGWEKGNADQILSTMARKDDIVMYGTDLAERWIGYEALVSPTEAMVEAFTKPVYTWGENEPKVWVRDEVGWVCGDLTIDMELDGDTVQVTMRSTFVVVREADEWEIAHAHFSIGQEEPAATYD